MIVLLFCLLLIPTPSKADMAKWFDAIKDKLGDLQESIGDFPITWQWIISALVLLIIILVGVGIVRLFQFLF